MNLDDLRRLLAYRVWAREQVLAVVKAMPSEAFTTTVVSSFPSLQATLVHVLDADITWTMRLHGVLPTDRLKPGDFPDVAALRARWAQVDSDLRTAVEGPPPANPDRMVEYRTSAGVPDRRPLAHIVQHMVNHQTCHFGQVTTLVRQLGGRPAQVDLVAFDRLAGGR